MFREMRRKKQQLPNEEAIAILKRSSTCTLALIGDDGYPYSLPINYSYNEGKIFIHCAKAGHKIDAVKGCNKISLSVIDCDEIYQEKLTNKYRSVIVFGKAKLLEDKVEIAKACRYIAEKTCPNTLDSIDDEINRFIDETAIIEITPEHITGKEGLELYKLRNK